MGNDTTNPLDWCSERDLDSLVMTAVDREVYAGRALLDTADLGDPDVVDATPAVAVVLDRDGRAEPWLLYPHPRGWAAAQALLDEGWKPTPSTYGLVSDPNNVGTRVRQVLDDLQTARELPIGQFRRDDGRWGVRDTKRVRVDSRDQQQQYRDERHLAVNDVQNERALADAIATQRRRVRHLDVDEPELATVAEELVTDLVTAGLHLHDCNAPHFTSDYRASGVCLTPDRANMQILVTWNSHDGAGVGRGLQVGAFLNEAVHKILTTRGYPARWDGNAVAVPAERW